MNQPKLQCAVTCRFEIIFSCFCLRIEIKIKPESLWQWKNDFLSLSLSVLAFCLSLSLFCLMIVDLEHIKRHKGASRLVEAYCLNHFGFHASNHAKFLVVTTNQNENFGSKSFAARMHTSAHIIHAYACIWITLFFWIPSSSICFARLCTVTEWKNSMQRSENGH